MKRRSLMRNIIYLSLLLLSLLVRASEKPAATDQDLLKAIELIQGAGLITPWEAERLEEKIESRPNFAAGCVTEIGKDWGETSKWQIEKCKVINNAFSLRCIKAVVADWGDTETFIIEACANINSEAQAGCVESVAKEWGSTTAYQINECAEL
jgi:hypothetical protein